MGAAVDTLQIYERLMKAELGERAAKELAEVFKETIDEQLATKSDLARLKTELEAAIAASASNAKAEIIKWVAGMLVAQAAVIAALVKLLQ